MLSVLASMHPAKAVGEDRIADEVQGLLATLLALIDKLPVEALKPVATWVVAQHLASPAPGSAIAEAAVRSVERLLVAGDTAAVRRAAMAATSESSGVLKPTPREVGTRAGIDASAAEAALQSALAFAQSGGTIAENLAAIIEQNLGQLGSAADAPTREAAVAVAGRLREAIEGSGTSLVASDTVGDHSAELPFGPLSSFEYHTSAARADRELIDNCRDIAAAEGIVERCSSALNGHVSDAVAASSAAAAVAGADGPAATAQPIIGDGLGSRSVMGEAADWECELGTEASACNAGGLVQPWHADAPSVCVTGGSDPLSIEASVLPDADARCVRLCLNVTNATEVTVSKAAVRVGLVGPVAFASPAAHAMARLPRLAASDSCALDFTVACTAPGRATLCVQVLLYPEITGPDDEEEDWGADAHAPPLPNVAPNVLRCVPYTLPISATFVRAHCAPGDFYTRWDALPHAITLRALYAGGGGKTGEGSSAARSAASFLSAMGTARRNNLSVVASTSEPVRSASLLARTWWGDTLALALTETHTASVSIAVRSSSFPLVHSARVSASAFLADLFGASLVDAESRPRGTIGVSADVGRPGPGKATTDVHAAAKNQDAVDQAAIAGWRVLKGVAA